MELPASCMRFFLIAFLWFASFGVTSAQQLVDYPVSGLDTASEKFERVYRMVFEDVERNAGKSLNCEASIKEHLKDLGEMGDFWLANITLPADADNAAGGKNKDVVIKFLKPKQFAKGEKGAFKLQATGDSMEMESRPGSGSFVTYPVFIEDDGPLTKEKFIEKLKAGHEFAIPLTLPGKEPAVYVIKW